MRRDDWLRRDLPAVAGLTLIALAVRLAGIGESLYGDELHTFVAADVPSLGDVVGAMQLTEDNPPLFYFVEWVLARVGDPTVFLRLPSLVLGTATVPLVYALGRRTVGRTAGLVAAALIALSPFAIVFSYEARAYTMLGFFAALSTLALLIALDTGRLRWFALFTLASAAALYTHYTAVFVLGVQGAWALWHHRDRARELLLSYAAVAVAFLPWLPYMADQGGQDKPGLPVIEALFGFSLESVGRYTVTLLAGHHLYPLREVAGRTALLVLGVALALALAGTVLRARRSGAARPGPGLQLIVLLAFATPVGVLIYCAVGPDIYISRYLFASLPAIAVLLGALLTYPRPPLRELAVLLALGALAVGTARALDASRDRPAFREAAQIVDDSAAPGDPVVEYLFAPVQGIFARHLAINFEEPHPLTQMYGNSDPGAWERIERAERFFVVLPWGPGARAGAVPPRVARRFRVAEQRDWPGLVRIGVLVYERRNR
ncbi:MAG: mannosyltransferase [Thermoleophilaceae bacterium]|nr:mannosyltransferase [Thermoleophilaceae bacterium]